MKQIFSIFALFLLLLLPMIVSAQEDAEDDSVPYMDLGTNYSVPELPNWENQVEGETVLFSNAGLNAQIYVAAFDTLDIDAAIASASTVITSGDLGEPLYSSRIGRNDGTWEYRLFNNGDTSMSAYGLLKSNRSYVVLFIENSADYAAYHLALRSTIPNPENVEMSAAISAASQTAIQAVINPDFEGEILNASNPAADTPNWILEEYADGLATASYLKDNIAYVTIVNGETQLAQRLSNDFDSVFLGFIITPNNSEYLYLGLGFSVVIYFGLIASMWLRHQNLKKDVLMLEQLVEG